MASISASTVFSEHGYHLFEEVLHVPLIIRGPGVPSEVTREDLVSLVDVFETICDLCNLPEPSTNGRSMFSGPERDAVFAENGMSPQSAFDGTPYERNLSDERFEMLATGKKGMKTSEYSYIRYSNGQDEVFERPDDLLVAQPPEDFLKAARRRTNETLASEFIQDSRYNSDELEESLHENLKQLGYID